MAAANCLLSEDQFLCSICLDLFADPVTTPCGHNFCNSCITTHWDIKVPVCQCPICNKIFKMRPDVHTNTFISELVAQFRQEVQEEQQVPEPGDVLCDVCTGTKVKALKSCLVCLVSYCKTHLEPHLTTSHLKRHQLIGPVDKLEDRMCKKHDTPLELFCITDQTCVCALCLVIDHKMHKVVPMKEEYEGKKLELQQTQFEVHQLMRQRRAQLHELKRVKKISSDNKVREKEEDVGFFTVLKESVDRHLKMLLKNIEDKHKKTDKVTKGFISELEKELSELMKISAEAEQLSISEDHLHLIQRVPSLKAAPTTRDWKEVMVRPTTYEGTLMRAVSELEDTLGKETKRLNDAELKRIRQCEVDVTFDHDTANPHLHLSKNGKQLSWKKWLWHENTPQRFHPSMCVLGRQSFCSGKFYFEVQVKGNPQWVLGVAKESINRKGRIILRPQEGFWTIWHRNGMTYKALNSPSVCLSVRSPPEKVGVFVDCEEGLVSFHDPDTAALIYSFSGCTFTEKLKPFFNAFRGGFRNSTPMIICPATQTCGD